ncbi:MAG TPA: hypothetical protein VNL34_04890 [Candidatus Nitrosotenuis sp.]|nr:hypothetical protein [Candidatus Nitrosotenuis sp.]
MSTVPKMLMVPPLAVEKVLPEGFRSVTPLGISRISPLLMLNPVLELVHVLVAASQNPFKSLWQLSASLKTMVLAKASSASDKLIKKTTSALTKIICIVSVLPKPPPNAIKVINWEINNI